MRATFLMVLGLLAPAASQLAPRITVSHGCTGFSENCAMDLVEGLDQWVSLTLDEPIICNNQEIECAVIVNISNSHPNIIAVEPCYVRWHRDEWHHTKRVRVTARQSYTHNGRQEVHLETDVVTQAEYYRTFDPADLYIVAEERRTATCASVGDPHYTTFDGLYWHFYDGRSRNPARLTLYRSTSRDFVIQNQVRGYPAGNCGIAAREGRDRVVVNNCGGSLQIITDYHSEIEEHRPRVQVSGSTYTVYFYSGAYVRMSTRSWMDLHVGGIDYQRACGICGNFDGNAANDAPVGRGGVVTAYTNLFACQQVPSVVSGSDTFGDLWNWVYDEDDFAVQEDTDDVPDSQQDCPYELQRIVRPVINTEDIEDITDALRDRANAIRNQNGGVFTFDEATGDTTVLQPYPLEQATQDCTELIEASTTVSVCRRRYTEFNERIPDYTQDCAFDYSEMGGPESEVATEFFEGIIRVMEQHCLELTIENGDANDVDLQRVLCENACTGHGTCGNGASCTCEDGWDGDDCSINLNAPPDVRIVSDLVYDVTGTQQGMSPAEISLTGTNFLNSPMLTCRWGNATTSQNFTTNGTYVGPRSVICPVPTFRHTGVANLNLPLTVSNDGSNWSAGRFNFLFYDATCQSCNERGECGRNNETCTVGSGDSAQCFLAHMGATGDDANPCQKCLPEVSNTRLAFSYSHRLCRPEFSAPIYQHIILGSAQENDIMLTVDGAANSLVNGDQDPLGYGITYTYVPGDDRDPNVRQWFDVDANGNVVILRDVDISDPAFMNMEHAAADPRKFSGHFQVRATDRQNYSTTATVIIQLVPADHRPIFPAGGFTGIISENPTNGDQVMNTTGGAPGNAGLAIQAVDPDPEADLSSVRYSWHMEPFEAAGALLIDAETGVVTVGNASKVDFETTELLHYQVRARDNALLFYVADVRITVTNVDEPPTAVLLNGTTEARITENSVGNIGNLTTVDPEGGPFTYLLSDNVHYTLERYADGVFYLNLSTPFDFEATGSSAHTVEITSTDNTGRSVTQTLNVLVTNVNEAPGGVVISNPSSLVTMTGNQMTLAEDTPLAQPLADVTANDPEGSVVTCYVADQFFVIQNNQLQLKQTLDFETVPTLTLLVVCEDDEGEQSDIVRIAVTVTNANEAPWVVGWTNSQDEGVAEGVALSSEVLVGTVIVRDDAGSVSATIVAANSSLFRVNTPNCGGDPLQCSAEVFLLVGATVSYEEYGDVLGPGLYPIFLTLSDNSGESTPLSATVGPPATEVTMRVTDVPEAPTGITLNSTSIGESPAMGQMIALATVDDEDVAEGQFEITLTANPNDAFALAPVSGGRREVGGTDWMLTVNNPAAFDFETNPSLSFTVSVTDMSMPATADRTITVTRTVTVTDAPMLIEAAPLTLSGEVGLSGVVFSLTNMDRTDLVDDITWSLIGVTWATLVKNADGSAELQVTAAQTFEPNDVNANIRQVRVRATFGTSSALPQREWQNVLTIIEVQNAPVFETASLELSVGYFAAAPVELTSVSATDPDQKPGQAMEFFVARMVTTGDCTGANCFSAYIAPKGGNNNRYITSAEYADTNDVSGLTMVTYRKDTTQYSTCTQIVAGDDGSFGCDLRIEEVPTAGVIGTTVTGLFVVAKKAAATDREFGTDMELAAFLPTTIRYRVFGDNGTPTPAPGVSIDFADASNAEDDSDATAPWVWILVVLVLVLVVLGAAAGYFWYQKNHNHTDLFDGKEGIYAATSSNPGWNADPVPYEAVPFVPGVRSAMYDWYHPDMARKECSDHLMKRGEGAFVVRDSDANPGWFMLGVKSQNQVVHDKVRTTENGEVQLLPSAGKAASVPQPCFPTLPDLIDHYLKEQPGMPYTLSAADPIYDNQRLAQERTGVLARADQNGPSVPVKNREYVEADYSFGAGSTGLGGDSVGNPMYFAGPNDAAPGAGVYAAPGTAGQQRAHGYLDVEPGSVNANANANPTYGGDMYGAGASGGYLDVDPTVQGSAAAGYQDIPAATHA